MSLTGTEYIYHAPKIICRLSTNPKYYCREAEHCEILKYEETEAQRGKDLENIPHQQAPFVPGHPCNLRRESVVCVRETPRGLNISDQNKLRERQEEERIQTRTCPEPSPFEEWHLLRCHTVGRSTCDGGGDGNRATGFAGLILR